MMFFIYFQSKISSDTPLLKNLATVWYGIIQYAMHIARRVLHSGFDNHAIIRRY